MATTDVDVTSTEFPPQPCCGPDADGVEQLGACLRGSLGWLMSRAAQGYERVVERTLAEVDVSMREFVVLMVLRGGSAPQQQTLAKAAGIDKTTLVAALDQLERRQLIRRRPDARDRRVRILELTDEGRALADRIGDIVDCVEATMLAALEPAERDSLFRALRYVVDATEEECSVGGSCV